MIGQTLAHYRVTAALGAGGMGEVYRATDTKLNRDVAIKVLPSEVAEDPERLARFRREAQLLASLNHTNIAAIYGLEEAEGKPFLALELVEGEDLKERLERGRSRSTTPWTSPSRSPRPSRRRTRRASSTATSSPRT
jgi:serine/threonine protein kinase